MMTKILLGISLILGTFLVGAPAARAEEQPLVRVGLYKTAESVTVKTSAPYTIYSGSQLQGDLPANTTATLQYKDGVYAFSSEDLVFVATGTLRLVPTDAEGYFTLTNYSRLVAGRKKINFNVYRGTLEYRYSPKSALPYIINELPLEQYVAGVTETSNDAPLEYIKALQTAARTYAYSMRAPFSAKHLFDVYATTADQLYLGYQSEKSMPRVVEASEATAGEMVTYKGRPVMTNYFGHSSGKTKTVKGKPWLQSVEAVYDVGKKMWGHGVGMSCNDALQRARKDGWTYDRVLMYYYSGTTVERMY